MKSLQTISLIAAITLSLSSWEARALPPGVTGFTTNQTVFSESFNYGGGPANLVSNFHGWYLGPEDGTPSSSATAFIDYKNDGPLPGFSTSGYATKPPNEHFNPYGFAGKLFTNPVTNQTVMLTFSMRTGASFGSAYQDFVFLTYDMQPHPSDAGKLQYTDAATAPVGIDFTPTATTTNIRPQTGYGNIRSTANPFAFTTNTTYGIRFLYNLSLKQSFLEVRTYNEGTSSWGSYVNVDNDWVNQNVSDATPSINYLNGVGLFLAEYQGGDNMVSDITVITTTLIPEPSSVALAGLALGGLLFLRRKRA